MFAATSRGQESSGGAANLRPLKGGKVSNPRRYIICTPYHPFSHFSHLSPFSHLPLNLPFSYFIRHSHDSLGEWIIRLLVYDQTAVIGG